MTSFVFLSVIGSMTGAVAHVTGVAIKAHARIRLISIAARTGRRIEVESSKVTFWPRPRSTRRSRAADRLL
jgi:hypothetical protein